MAIYTFLWFCVIVNVRECYVIDFSVHFWEDELVENIWRKKLRDQLADPGLPGNWLLMVYVYAFDKSACLILMSNFY